MDESVGSSRSRGAHNLCSYGAWFSKGAGPGAVGAHNAASATPSSNGSRIRSAGSAVATFALIIWRTNPFLKISLNPTSRQATETALPEHFFVTVLEVMGSVSI